MPWAKTLVRIEKTVGTGVFTCSVRSQRRRPHEAQRFRKALLFFRLFELAREQQFAVFHQWPVLVIYNAFQLVGGVADALHVCFYFIAVQACFD